MAKVNGTDDDLIPTLQNMCLLRIGIELWKSADVKNAIEDNSWKFYVQKIYSLDSNNFIKQEDSVRGKISRLLPKPLKRISFDTIRHTGLQICEWADFIIKILPDIQLNEILFPTFWTLHGTIDRFKSVHYWLQKCEDSSLFPLACFFCFETELTRMWNLMPDFVKHYYYREYNSQSGILLVDYWTCTLRGEFLEFKRKREHFFNSCVLRDYLRRFHIESPSDNAYMMLLLTLSGRFSGVKYFCSKLEAEEKNPTIEYCLEIAITYERLLDEMYCYEYFDITYFLLHQMSLDKQKQFLRQYKSFYIVRMVYHWSYQRFIAKTLTQMWEFLTVDIYCILLAVILGQKISGKYIRKFLLENIWYITPIDLKENLLRYVLSHTNYIFCFEGCSIPVMQIILGVLSTTESNEILSYLEI